MLVLLHAPVQSSFRLLEWHPGHLGVLLMILKILPQSLHSNFLQGTSSSSSVIGVSGPHIAITT